ASRLAQLLVKEALPRCMLVAQTLCEEVFVGLLAVLGRPAETGFRIHLGVDEVVLERPFDVRLDVLEGESFGVFFAPIIQRRADWFGSLETRDVVTGKAAELVDGLLANEVFQLA